MKLEPEAYACHACICTKFYLRPRPDFLEAVCHRCGHIYTVTHNDAVTLNIKTGLLHNDAPPF